MHLNGDVEECTIYEDDFEVFSKDIIAFNVVLPKTKYDYIESIFIQCICYIEKDKTIVIEEMQPIFAEKENWYPVRLCVWKSKVLMKRYLFHDIFSVYPSSQPDFLEGSPKPYNVDDSIGMIGDLLDEKDIWDVVSDFNNSDTKYMQYNDDEP